MLFAEIVAKNKQTHPLFLEAALPYPGRIKTKDQNFHRLLAKCNGINTISEAYHPSCYMVQRSSRVIAIYDGREKGGTFFTMRYAHILEREMRLIRV